MTLLTKRTLLTLQAHSPARNSWPHQITTGPSQPCHLGPHSCHCGFAVDSPPAAQRLPAGSLAERWAVVRAPRARAAVERLPAAAPVEHRAEGTAVQTARTRGHAPEAYEAAPGTVARHYGQIGVHETLPCFHVRNLPFAPQMETDPAGPGGLLRVDWRPRVPRTGYIQTCVFTYIYLCMYIYVYIYMHVYLHTCIYIFIYIYTCVYT